MNDRLAKAKVMGHTLDHILIKSFIEQVKRLGTVGGPRNQLANHWVVIHRDLTTFLHSCVNPDILMRFWLLVLGQETDGGEEIARGVLGIDAILNRVSIDIHIVLSVFQLVTG